MDDEFVSSNTETVLKKYKDIRIIHSDRGSQYTLLVVEHDKDIIKIADEIIDVGTLAGMSLKPIFLEVVYLMEEIY